MVPPDSDRVSPAPPYSGYSHLATRFRIRGFHALRPAFPGRSSTSWLRLWLSFNPTRASTPVVWAPPLSLAATRGITVVFSSCGYLDVSVPRVDPTFRGDTSSRYQVPPFGHPGINGYLLLPLDYRSLSRPSSSLRAQASPVRSYLYFSSRVKNCKSFTFDSVARHLRRATLCLLCVLSTVCQCPCTSVGVAGGHPLSPMVENNGLEPMTSCLQSMRSTS